MAWNRLQDGFGKGDGMPGLSSRYRCTSGVPKPRSEASRGVASRAAGTSTGSPDSRWGWATSPVLVIMN